MLPARIIVFATHWYGHTLLALTGKVSVCIILYFKFVCVNILYIYLFLVCFSSSTGAEEGVDKHLFNVVPMLLSITAYNLALFIQEKVASWYFIFGICRNAEIIGIFWPLTIGCVLPLENILTSLLHFHTFITYCRNMFGFFFFFFFFNGERGH